MRQRNYILFLLLCLTGLGCKEFIEPSIKDQKVILLAPASNTETKDYTQTFWWETTEDALYYRLQVVSPGFDQINKLIVDTLIKTNKYKYTLDPGTYQWRVRAENGSSQTSYTTAKLTIYPTSITEQQVQLVSPANNTVTNQANAVFNWLKLFGADSYKIQIDTTGNGFDNAASLFLDKTTPNVSYSVSLPKDKLYQWRIKALSGILESKWSAVQNLSFDATPPPVVVLSSPSNNSTVSNPVTLKWNASADAKKYILYVYKGDSNNAYNSTFPLTLTGLSYVFNLGTSGEKISWEVKAVDDAGNTSAKGELRSFVIQ
jgi:hypothetical protein